MHSRPLRIGLLTSSALVFAMPGAATAQDAKTIVASQIRSQGYTCDQPKSATRDAKASKPYAVVWVLVCETNSYRVTLVPNLAAQVEVLSGNNDESASAPR